MNTTTAIRPLRIASIGGDGIGPAVTAVGRAVVDAVATRSHAFQVDWTHLPWGSQHFMDKGRMMPADGLELLREFDAIYFGAVGWPTIPDHVSLWGLRLAICQGLDLWANVRPVVCWPGVHSVLTERSAYEPPSWVVVRENSEGEYVGIGGRNLAARGKGGEIAVESAVFTEVGCERIIRYSFDVARNRRTKRVTCVTKSNAQRYGMVLWDEIFGRVAADYPDVETDSCLVDAMAARMVLAPESLSVAVATNLHADILSDLGSALAGSLGLGASANLDPTRRAPSMFEPVHGSAPDIKDPATANPIGAIASAQLMLSHLGFGAQAQQIQCAIGRTTGAGILPADLGGRSTTSEFQAAVIANLGSDLTSSRSCCAPQRERSMTSAPTGRRGERSACELAVWIGPQAPAALVAPLQQIGVLASCPERADVLVWTQGPEGATEVLHPGIKWVQLGSAGVDDWVASGVLDHERIWTNASEAVAERVAEHALCLVLAAAKGLPAAGHQSQWDEDIQTTVIRGATVGIVGAGAIGRATLRLLRPFGARLIATTRSGRAVPEADISLPATGLGELLQSSDFVILAAPLTTETSSMIGARELDRMGPSSSLINVARGRLVDTDALTTALCDQRIRYACLDVTEPEPLPSAHRLWQLPNALITPHIANSPETHLDSLKVLLLENLSRFRRGDELLGVIDVTRGY